MSPSITEYIIDEQDDWKDSIRFNLGEAEELQEWLQQILNFNTIPKLAAYVEHYLNALSLCRQNLSELQTSIDLLRGKLNQKQRPGDDSLITEAVMNQQKELRKKMFSIEREYLEIKYNTSDFLAETIAKQNIARKK